MGKDSITTHRWTHDSRSLLGPASCAIREPHIHLTIQPSDWNKTPRYNPLEVEICGYTRCSLGSFAHPKIVVWVVFLNWSRPWYRFLVDCKAFIKVPHATQGV